MDQTIKMRAVIISKAFVRGAYQRKLEEMARLPGVSLTLITPPAWTDGGHRVVLERRYTDGYDIVVAPLWLDGHFHLHFYPTLGRLLGKLRPDIVHIDEEPYNLATFQAIVTARRHGARTLFFTWQNINRRLPPPFSWMERFNLGRADYALAGSKDASDVLRQKGFRGPIGIVPQLGVDAELYHPRSNQSEGCGAAPISDTPALRSLTVGYVGRFVREKGLLDLLEAVAGLDCEWRLVLVGEGPLRGEIERRSRALGVDSRVQLRSPLPSTEIPAVLTTFDVLVLPSVSAPNWREQFGRILIEAMACEVPVVGSDSGEIPEVIGDAGLVFPEGTPVRLRACLAYLAADPAARRRLGKRGRERVLQRYTQQRVARATYEVYREILSGTASSPTRS